MKPKTAKQWNQDEGLLDIPMPPKSVTKVYLVNETKVRECIQRERMEILRHIEFVAYHRNVDLGRASYDPKPCLCIEEQDWQAIKDKYLKCP